MSIPWCQWLPQIPGFLGTIPYSCWQTNKHLTSFGLGHFSPLPAITYLRSVTQLTCTCLDSSLEHRAVRIIFLCYTSDFARRPTVAFLFTWVKLTRLALPDRAAIEGISTSLFLPLNRSTLIREASLAFTYSSSSVPPSMTPSPRKCPLYRNVSLVQSVYRKCNTGHFLFRQTAPFEHLPLSRKMLLV